MTILELIDELRSFCSRYGDVAVKYDLENVRDVKDIIAYDIDGNPPNYNEDKFVAFEVIIS